MFMCSLLMMYLSVLKGQSYWLMSFNLTYLSVFKYPSYQLMSVDLACSVD